MTAAWIRHMTNEALRLAIPLWKTACRRAPVALVLITPTERSSWLEAMFTITNFRGGTYVNFHRVHCIQTHYTPLSTAAQALQSRTRGTESCSKQFRTEQDAVWDWPTHKEQCNTFSAPDEQRTICTPMAITKDIFHYENFSDMRL